MAYNFSKQLKIGQYFEKKLDPFLITTKKYTSLYTVNLDIQKLGIDRFGIDEHGHKYSIEYKTDLKAHLTENLFLETEVKGNPGWIHKCIANEIYIYIPVRGLVLQFDMKGIRDLLLAHSHQNELVVKNEGFTAKGILAPLKVAMTYSKNNYRRDCLVITPSELNEIVTGIK